LEKVRKKSRCSPGDVSADDSEARSWLFILGSLPFVPCRTIRGRVRAEPQPCDACTDTRRVSIRQVSLPVHFTIFANY